VSGRERRRRQRGSLPAGGAGRTPLIRIGSPFQLALVLLGLGMVLCMIASTCLKPL
jgi:hypothetical protein